MNCRETTNITPHTDFSPHLSFLKVRMGLRLGGAVIQFVLTTQGLIYVFFEKPKQTILFLCHYPKNHYFCYHIIINNETTTRL